MRLLSLIALLIIYNCEHEIGSENAPDWEDQPGIYQFTAYLVGGIVLSGGEPLAGPGDLFAAFDETDNIRGVAVQLSPPFGPYQGQIVYEMTIRSNLAGDILSFKYYDASANAVLNIVETYDFTTNEQLGDMIEPILFTIINMSNDE